MKTFGKLTAVAGMLMLLLILGANALILGLETDSEKGYRVEISRAAREIAEEGLPRLDLQKYPSLVRVTAGEGPDFLKGGQEEYALREIEGRLYRFDYIPGKSSTGKLLLIVNGFLGLGAILLLGILLFLGRQIVSPFETMKKLPEELAKGNLTMPLQQQKSRYFGNFLWGMDLLREKLEQQKVRELALQKEKKSLILSLCHDIKTPLSAIKLYSQALERNLYGDPGKQKEIAGKIGGKADEMEGYLREIVEASQEDFLQLEVHNGEFYLKEVEKGIRSYYKDKLELLKIPCTMDFGEDCLLKGDRDRVQEILQNLMENAIKYGDGGPVSVSSGEEGDCRILTVRNENCSLPKEELPHIFDSFWRGSNSGKIQGSGLGLYICRQLAMAMGGELFAEIKDNKMEVSLVLSKA